jgi:hypothetical protein
MPIRPQTFNRFTRTDTWCVVQLMQPDLFRCTGAHRSRCIGGMGHALLISSHALTRSQLPNNETLSDWSAHSTNFRTFIVRSDNGFVDCGCSGGAALELIGSSLEADCMRIEGCRTGDSIAPLRSVLAAPVRLRPIHQILIRYTLNGRSVLAIHTVGPRYNSK